MSNDEFTTKLIFLGWDINKFGYAESKNEDNSLVIIGENQVLINSAIAPISCNKAFLAVLQKENDK